MIKRITILLLILSALFGYTSQSIASTTDLNALNVTVNDQPVVFNNDHPFISKTGQTVIPLRIVAESLGAQVNWDDQSQQISISKGSKIIEMKIGDNKALVNNKETGVFDSTLFSKNGRAMIPVRIIAELLDAQVSWEATTKTVGLTINNGYNLPAQTDLQIVTPLPSSNPDKVDIRITIFLNKDLPIQYANVESVLRSKFDESLVTQIVNHVSLKKESNMDLEYAKWKVNGQNIEVSSETGSDTILIKICLPRT